MTKEEALSKIEELKAYVEREDSKQLAADRTPFAERFTTAAGRTGLLITLPTDETIGEYAKEIGHAEKVVRSMKATEFFARLFVARGGKVWSGVDTWNDMKYSVGGKDGAKLWTVSDLLGSSWFVVVSTEQDVESGKGLSFNDVKREGLRLLNPIEWLALAHTAPDITDPTTYPAWKYWEWVDAMDESYAAGGYSDSDGLNLGWRGPGASADDGRSRSAVS